MANNRPNEPNTIRPVLLSIGKNFSLTVDQKRIITLIQVQPKLHVFLGIENFTINLFKNFILNFLLLYLQKITAL